MPLVLLAGCAALVVEAFAALVHTGGNVNDLLPAYLVVALLAGLAMGASARRFASRRRPVRAAALARAVHAVAPRRGRTMDSRRGQRPGHRADRGAGGRFPPEPGVPAGRGPRRRPAAGDGRASARRHGRDPCRLRRSRSWLGCRRAEDQVAAADVLRASDQSRQGDLHDQPRAGGGRAEVQRDHHRVLPGTCGASPRTCRATTTGARRRRWTASRPFRSPRTPGPCRFPYGCPPGTGPPAPRSSGRSSPRSLR